MGIENDEVDYTDFDDADFDDLDFFLPDDADEIFPSDLAEKEAGFFGAKAKENSVVIPLWGNGYISFNPKDSVSIFAILALFLLILAVFLTAFLGIFAGDTTWLDRIFTALGHAITGVVGAIVGSAATKK